MQKIPWLAVDMDTGDCLVTIHVKTRQQTDGFVINPDQFLIRVTTTPIKGRANKKILKLIRKKFKTDVILETGHKSSKKVIRLKNVTQERVLALVNEDLGVEPQVASM